MTHDKTRAVLNQAVADLSQFSVVIHQTHWYMRGSGFLSLHPKMDDLMDDINDILDVVAERLITIGGRPYSTLKEFSDNTKIKDEIGTYDKTTENHIKNLLTGYRYLIELSAEGISVTDDENDHVSQDVFIDMKGSFEKMVWMLAAEIGEAPNL